jgi:MFS family permease
MPGKEPPTRWHRAPGVGTRARMEASRAAPAESSVEPTPVAPSAWMALGVLFLVYLLNFLDRTLIYILFAPIKSEMAFSDTQLALLGTTSFVIFYTVLGVPFGRLADRVSRKKLIAAGLATWSLFSGLTGFADSFLTLFLCRVMVGVGEATLGPAAMSLLADLFPARRHGMVQSLYSAGIPLGAAAAFFLGGQIAAAWGWRAAFFTLGFPGLLLALAVLALPERARTTRPAVAASSPLADLRTLWGLRVLRWHVVGYAVFAVASNALSIWVPKLVVGSMVTAKVGATPAPEALAAASAEALKSFGNFSGLSMAVAGGLATAFGGALADRWRSRGAGGRLRFGALLAGLCVVPWVAITLSTQTVALQAAFFVLAGIGLAWLGGAAADVHAIAPPSLRGLGIASYYLVVNLVGYGIAPLVVGKVSDASDLRTALWICPVACAVAAGVLWRAAALQDEAGAVGTARG